MLAVLITVLNFSSADSLEIIRGMEFLGFLTALENIIKNKEVPLVTKSVSLLAISNLYTMMSQNLQKGRNPPKVSTSTRNFALSML